MTVTTDQVDSTSSPDEPSVEPQDPAAAGTGRRAPDGRRRVALVIVCVLAVLAEAVVAVRLVDARSSLSEANDQLSVRNTRLADLNAELTSTRLRVEALRTDAATRRNETEDVDGSLTVRDLELSELDGSLARLQDKSAAASASIATANGVDQEQVKQLVTLTQCLNGIKQANLAAAAGRSSDVVAALQSVADICQQTLAIMSPGDTASFPYDFPDPSVVYANDNKYYAYSTNGGGGRVQVLTSTDLKKWTLKGEALASLPGWAQPGYTWAPSVLRRDNTYYLYYTARRAGGKMQCISVATSSNAGGPFVDQSDGPMVCQTNMGGSIDPSPFVASDGTFYLLWKSEGETPQGTGGAHLWIGKLTEDFKGIDGDPTNLLGVNRAWEGRTIEGPSMVESNGKFFLFYSANNWATPEYAAGYAVCEAPTGPCTKPADNVFLKKDDKLDGPGGAEVFVAPGGQLWVSYHAWTHGNVGWPNRRQLYVKRLNLSSGRPVLS